MAWIEMEFCRVPDDMPAADRDFIDEAFFQLNFWRPVIESFFSGRRDSGDNLFRHFDGRSKTKVKTKEHLRGIGTAALGRLAMLDAVGTGRLLLDQDLVRCCRRIHSGEVATFEQGGAQVPFTLGDRYWALLEVAAIILHELNHVVWRLGEERATCMEGFFRFHVQDQLGIQDFVLCGQTAWPCGDCAGRQPGCNNGSDLLAAITDLSSWPLIAGCPHA